MVDATEVFLSSFHLLLLLYSSYYDTDAVLSSQYLNKEPSLAHLKLLQPNQKEEGLSAS